LGEVFPRKKRGPLEDPFPLKERSIRELTRGDHLLALIPWGSQTSENNQGRTPILGQLSIFLSRREGTPKERGEVFTSLRAEKREKKYSSF